VNTKTAATYEIGHLYEVAPGELKIGTNVRTDTRPDAKDFAASIRSRGVLEVISAYVDDEGSLTVLRGQRRTVVAVTVGAPTVPVRVVPSPDEVDRIVDQVSENVHRQDMHARETRDAIEQLAIIGVSAAQIAKRVALPRATVNNALTVAANPATKERMDAAGMTLEDAATFAEFEDDPGAIATLTQAWESPYQRPRIAHIVQRLRNERADAQALQAEVDRLRTDGLPVLDPQDVPGDLHRHRIANLRDADGQHVPEGQWPAVTGGCRGRHRRVVRRGRRQRGRRQRGRCRAECARAGLRAGVDLHQPAGRRPALRHHRPPPRCPHGPGERGGAGGARGRSRGATRGRERPASSGDRQQQGVEGRQGRA